MKKYIILGLFFAVHTCVQGASGISGIGSKRDRKECIEQAELSEVIQNQVFRLCGKSYRALSYDDLDRLRKKRSDLYNAIQTQWALELFGPGHEVIDDMLYRDGAVVGSFDHQKSAEGDSVRRQAAKRLYQKYKPRYGLSVSPLSSAAAALCAVDQKFKTEHDSRLQTPTACSGRQSRSDFSVDPVSPASQTIEIFFADPKTYLRS